MKYILSFFLTLSVLCTSLSAVEYGRLIVEESGLSEGITLEDGDALTVLAYHYTGSGGTFADNYSNGPSLRLYYGNNSSDEDKMFSFDVRNISGVIGYVNGNSGGGGAFASGTTESRTFVGPCTIRIHHSQTAYLAYKLTRASEVEYKNVNIVALPTSTVGAGTHEIVVEASDDLQTWTPVHSSSIGGSKAFFRTRVVEAGE